MGSPESRPSKEQEKPQTFEQMLASMNAPKVHEHEHGHGHSKKGEDAAMGGHLGTEVVEKVGHNAHHAVGHGAGHGEAAGHAAEALVEAKSQGAHATAEAVSEAKSHGAHATAEALSEAKSHGAHATVEAISEAKGHGAHHAAEAVSQAKGHGAHAGAEALTQAKGHGAEVLGDTIQASQPGAHGLSKVHETTSEAVKHGADAGHHLSTGLTTALGVSAAASGGIGAYMLYAGGKELAHGVKEKDGEKIAEGVGGLAVGARSVAAGTVMASMASNSAILADVASVAGQALTPLGLVHGAIDVGLGVKDLVKSDKIDELLKVGFGTTVIAGAVIGGIPLTVAALGLLGAKVTRGVIKSRKAKKEAATAEAAQQQQPKPPVQPETTAGVKDVKT